MESVMTKPIVAIVVGSALGVIGSRVLFVGSWLSLVPWTIVGLALGAWCVGREWTWVGALYGFFISFVFMVSGYSGTASLVSRLPFFAGLGAFGAICGLVLTFAGFIARRTLSRLRT
jgi:hypothetical protein